jgi:hypothetical protein
MSRGGRRPDDRSGFAPLILVVDDEGSRRDIAEAILAKLRFAVIPVETIDKALSIMRAMRPEIIVCSETAAPKLREADVRDKEDLPIPVLPVHAGDRDPEILIDSIRTALRKRT